MPPGRSVIYDTTLANGAQGSAVSFSALTRSASRGSSTCWAFDDVKGGFRRNPKNEEMFARLPKSPLEHSGWRLGATRPRRPVEDNANSMRWGRGARRCGRWSARATNVAGVDRHGDDEQRNSPFRGIVAYGVARAARSASISTRGTSSRLRCVTSEYAVRSAVSAPASRSLGGSCLRITNGGSPTSTIREGVAADAAARQGRISHSRIHTPTDCELSRSPTLSKGSLPAPIWSSQDSTAMAKRCGQNVKNQVSVVSNSC